METKNETIRTETIQAEDISELLPQLDDAWYDSIEGVYAGNVPTWGPRTEMVETLIGSSCADGDIVSWDTRDADPANHLFLRRSWNPAHQSFESEHNFSIY